MGRLRGWNMIGVGVNRWKLCGMLYIDFDFGGCDVYVVIVVMGIYE